MTAAVAARPQPLRALAHANHVRMQRATLKADVNQGRVTMSALIASPPETISRLALAEALAWQRNWGPARVRRLLRQTEISELRQIGQLTERQRTLVLAVLRG